MRQVYTCSCGRLEGWHIQIWWRLLHGPGCGTSRVKVWWDGLFILRRHTYGWWCWDRCGRSCSTLVPNIMDNMLQMRWGLLHGLEHGLHLYGDGFSIELRMWQDVLRNNWWWHEDVHSHGLSVTVGLITWLIQTWGREVYKDVLALCWSIMAAVHMMTHDEVNMGCCSGHVDWMEGPTFHDGEQRVEIVTGWSMIMDWDDL